MTDLCTMTKKAKAFDARLSRAATWVPVIAVVAAFVVVAVGFGGGTMMEGGIAMLEKVKKLLTGACQFIGAFFIIWGGVHLATNLLSGASQDPSRLAPSFWQIAAGLLLVAISVLFGGLDTNWAVVS